MSMFRFSQREIIDLIVSVLAIAFIFSYPNFSTLIFIISLIAVGSGFIFHELMFNYLTHTAKSHFAVPLKLFAENNI